MKNIKLKLYIRTILFIIGFALFFLSFWENNIKSENIKRGDIIFVLDVSNSMNAKDVFYNGHKVSRLELAKKIIENNVKNIDNQFGLVLFSDRFDFFIPPTYDKDIFLQYLDTINTNNLNGGKTNFVKSINNLKTALSDTDILILLSDFDTDEDLTKIKLSNFIYPIGIGNINTSSIVKNKEGETLYNNGEILKSKLNTEKLKELAKLKKTGYKIINSYKKGEILEFIKDIQGKNLIEKKQKVDYKQIIGFVLIILSL